MWHDNKSGENEEFDLVLETNHGLIDVECKYVNRELTMLDYNEEVEQAGKTNMVFEKILFATKLGYNKDFQNKENCFVLDDFYSAENF